VRDPRIVSGFTRCFLHNLLPLAALLPSLRMPPTPSQARYTCAHYRALSPVQPPAPPTTSSSSFHSALDSSQPLASTRHTRHFIRPPLTTPNHELAYHWTPTHPFFPRRFPPKCSPPVCSEFGQLKHGDIEKLAQANQCLTRGR